MQAVPIRGSQCKGPEAATSKLGQPNGQKEGRSGGGRETRRRVREREVRENVGLGEIPGQNASAPAGWPRPLDFLISLRQEELAADSVRCFPEAIPSSPDSHKTTFQSPLKLS